MVEVPSLYWQLNSLLQRVDFLSIGSNDLFQFLFACDRGNPALVDRYDVLSPPALSFFHDMVERCRAAGVRLAVCGEMASRPLEAMALIGLGVHYLSLTPSEVGPVKAMLRSLDAARLDHYLRGLLDLPDHSLRGRLQAYAQDHGVVLPPSVYQPILISTDARRRGSCLVSQATDSAIYTRPGVRSGACDGSDRGLDHGQPTPVTRQCDAREARDQTLRADRPSSCGRRAWPAARTCRTSPPTCGSSRLISRPSKRRRRCDAGPALRDRLPAQLRRLSGPRRQAAGRELKPAVEAATPARPMTHRESVGESHQPTVALLTASLFLASALYAGYHVVRARSW